MAAVTTFPNQRALIIWSMAETQAAVLAMREDLRAKVGGGEVALEVFERVQDGELAPKPHLMAL